MVNVHSLVLALAVSTVHAVPVHLNKRIAQVIADSTAKWEQACLNAGGGQQCNPLSVAAFSTLLAAAGACDQQNAADNMIDLAKTLNNDPTMIKFTQIFVQQPRNTPNSVAVPYCQTAPKNSELNGLFQCQFQGSNQKVFVGNLQLGQTGTIPFGKTAPLNPLGSCDAHTSGPIADGSQLTDITSDPGVGSDSSTSSSSSGSTSNKIGSASSDTSTTAASATTTAASSTSSSSSDSSSDSSSSSGDFHLKNAQDAQALNAKFASLTADSSCTDGDQACVQGAFAQCVGGKFETTQCGGGLTCVALPLVNKAGTSITCDTESDAIARIQAAGGSASLTGDGSSSASSDSGTSSDSSSSSDNTSSSDTSSSSENATTSQSSSSSSSGDFHLKNAQDAQALNTKFASLTADSSCTDGEQACVQGAFAQCVGGKFETTQCGGGLMCVALPLVNKAGTSITCDTQADAIARMQAAGASPSLTG